MQMQRPIFWMTLLEYFRLILSSIASAESLLKSLGSIWTRSAILVCWRLGGGVMWGVEERDGSYEDEHPSVADEAST